MQFSIIIPLHNKAPYIRQTIESVFAQTANDLEIILVDDGSSDGSAQIVESITDPRLRLVKQANAGVSAARNRGIELARGQWIAFLDADDWHHPQYLATLDRLIAQYPAVDMVATQYKSIPYIEQRAICPWPVCPEVSAVELINDLPARWLQGTTFFTSSIAVRAALLRNTRPWFPEGESFGEDIDLWFRLAEASAIALSSEPLVARVWVPDGLSVVRAARLEAPFLQRMAVHARSGVLPHRLASSTQRWVDESRITLARSAIVAGERPLALELLGRACRSAKRLRWWVTLLMALLVPAIAVQHWQHWRKRRKMVLG